MEQSAAGIVAGIVPVLLFMEGAAFSAEICRVLDSAKVSDHYTITPTAEFVKHGSKLADREKNCLSLVYCKLLWTLASTHEYESITATFQCAVIS